MYFKNVENNIINAIGISKAVHPPCYEITEEEYINLLLATVNKPEDTLEHIYRLSAETNQYEPLERTRNETVEWYIQEVINEEITLDDIPEEYRAEVEQFFPDEGGEK